MAQPQLLQIALDPGDVVYTPDWVARDMVEYFKPSGRVLEPCKGEGAFMKYLPGADWCEITEGRDFFACNTQYDWIIGNPPYRLSGKWIRHSMDISCNFSYLLPCDKPFISYGMLKTVHKWGGIKHLRIYGGGASIGFPIGFAIGAIHYQKDYRGDMGISFARDSGL